MSTNRVLSLAAIGLASIAVFVSLSQAQTDNQVALNMGSSFYSNNSTYTDSTLHVWETATPASQNMSSSTLNSGASNLSGQSKSVSLLVARGDRLIHESYFHSANASQAKNIHSASKTITGMLTGIAISEGLLSLNTRIGDVLPHSMSSTKRNITVEHLLRMRSGISWTEDSTEYNLGSNFVQSILNLGQSNTPGSSFKYSTGDAYLLGAVLHHTTGMSLHQFAKSRLFDPLGVDVERWGRDNAGYFAGGHNFYVTPREMLRLGMLMANRGAYNGQQLVPAAWIDAMNANHGSPSYYGYQLWRDATLNGHYGYRAWGWGKQFIYVFPNDNLAVVITHDTNGSVSDGDLNTFVRNYVINAINGPAVPPPPPPPPVLPGDFNEDGVVDAADYTVWRNTSGTPDQYAIWKSHYGQATPAAAAGFLPVPESSAAVLAALASLGLYALCGLVRARCRKSVLDWSWHIRL